MSSARKFVYAVPYCGYFAAETINPRTRKLSRSGLNRVSDYAVLLRLFCRGPNLFWAS